MPLIYEVQHFVELVQKIKILKNKYPSIKEKINHS